MSPRCHWDRPPMGAPPALNSWLSGSWPTLAAIQKHQSESRRGFWMGTEPALCRGQKGRQSWPLLILTVASTTTQYTYLPFQAGPSYQSGSSAPSRNSSQTSLAVS